MVPAAPHLWKASGVPEEPEDDSMAEKKLTEVAEEISADASTKAARAAERAEELIRDVTAKAETRFEAIREDAGAYASKAGETIRDAAEGGKGKAADALHGIAEAVRELAGKAGADGTSAKAADFARKAADSMDKLSDVLKDKSMEDLGNDVRSFVKERPAVAIGVAAVLGFALARALKSGGDEA
jgi:ElaB/YqjD/DUF883 family membrane-anchored ribosome-binding protein